MKKIILVAFLINILIGRAQITGVTHYTVSAGVNTFGPLRQQISQNPAGEIFFYDPANFALVKFSGGTFTSIPMPFSSGDFLTNTFPSANGVWCYSASGEVYYLNGSTFLDYSANVSGLIGPVSNTNSINYMSDQGSNVLFATNKGIIKFDGTNFSLINKSNSTLICDTVNSICSNGSITYIGTDKGLCTFNGTVFTSPIQFTGAPSHKVNYIFSNGVKTIVTRKDNSSFFNYYELNSNQLTRLPAFADSSVFHSGNQKSMAFISNNPVFNRLSGGAFRLASSNLTYTTFVISSPSYIPANYVFPDPNNSSKFYTSGVLVHLARFHM